MSNTPRMDAARDNGWLGKLLYETGCDIERELAAVRAATIEECAKVCEGGSFLHDKAPAAIFAKECAAAIRALAKPPGIYVHELSASETDADEVVVSPKG